MGLQLAKFTLDNDVTLDAAYAHISAVAIDYDREVASITVLVHKDKAARDAGKPTVLQATSQITPSGTPERAAVPALVEEGTGKVVRNGIPAMAATPAFSEVFGDKRADANELSAAYAYLKQQPPFDTATDVLEAQDVVAAPAVAAGG